MSCEGGISGQLSAQAVTKELRGNHSQVSNNAARRAPRTPEACSSLLLALLELDYLALVPDALALVRVGLLDEPYSAREHAHLLPLFAYCVDAASACLVFPLMVGGSLQTVYE